jgi:hypothetical protein
VLLLGIAKWRNSLTRQSLVYDGDRQAPPDLLNLLPEGTDLDPDTWLTHQMLIPAFLRRIANASNIQHKIFLKESVHIYKILGVLDIIKFPPTHTLYVDFGTPPTWKDTIVSTTLRRILRNVHSISQW